MIFNPIIQTNSVTRLNTITTLFSVHPDNSKWWCIGVILKTLFPVFLKYATWIITDNVSNTGINATTNNNSGIFKYNAIAEITPPNKREPVSPINTFAGCKLNIKNPNTAPITMLPNTDISGLPIIIPITVKQVNIIALTLEAKPSIPSVKFTAFVVPNITIMANGIYK